MVACHHARDEDSEEEASLVVGQGSVQEKAGFGREIVEQTDSCEDSNGNKGHES